jgi:hypothetical protein
VAVDQTTAQILRVNTNTSSDECAGSKVDCSGDFWVGDFGYNQAAKASSCSLDGGGEACVISGIAAIFGCEDEETEDLFQCEHSDNPPAPELVYDFDVADGQYVVNLYFANTYPGSASVGDRIFDIYVEGLLVYDDFDQVAVGGGSGAASVRSAVVSVTDGNGLQIEFGHVTENPAIKAIEILGPAGG